MTKKKLSDATESRILDRWQAGMILGEIREAFGNEGIMLERHDVNNTIDRARRRGDKRAGTRRKYATTVRSS